MITHTELGITETQKNKITAGDYTAVSYRVEAHRLTPDFTIRSSGSTPSAAVSIAVEALDDQVWFANPSGVIRYNLDTDTWINSFYSQLTHSFTAPDNNFVGVAWDSNASVYRVWQRKTNTIQYQAFNGTNFDSAVTLIPSTAGKTIGAWDIDDEYVVYVLVDDATGLSELRVCNIASTTQTSLDIWYPYPITQLQAKNNVIVCLTEVPGPLSAENVDLNTNAELYHEQVKAIISFKWDLSASPVCENHREIDRIHKINNPDEFQNINMRYFNDRWYLYVRRYDGVDSGLYGTNREYVSLNGQDWSIGTAISGTAVSTSTPSAILEFYYPKSGYLLSLRPINTQSPIYISPLTLEYGPPSNDFKTDITNYLADYTIGRDSMQSVSMTLLNSSGIWDTHDLTSRQYRFAFRHYAIYRVDNVEVDVLLATTYLDSIAKSFAVDQSAYQITARDIGRSLVSHVVSDTFYVRPDSVRAEVHMIAEENALGRIATLLGRWETETVTPAFPGAPYKMLKGMSVGENAAALTVGELQNYHYFVLMTQPTGGGSLGAGARITDWLVHTVDSKNFLRVRYDGANLNLIHRKDGSDTTMVTTFGSTTGSLRVRYGKIEVYNASVTYALYINVSANAAVDGKYMLANNVPLIGKPGVFGVATESVKVPVTAAVITEDREPISLSKAITWIAAKAGVKVTSEVDESSAKYFSSQAGAFYWQISAFPMAGSFISNLNDNTKTTVINGPRYRVRKDSQAYFTFQLFSPLQMITIRGHGGGSGMWVIYPITTTAAKVIHITGTYPSYTASVSEATWANTIPFTSDTSPGAGDASKIHAAFVTVELADKSQSQILRLWTNQTMGAHWYYSVNVTEANSSPYYDIISSGSAASNPITNFYMPSLDIIPATLDPGESPISSIQRYLDGRYIEYMVRFNGTLHLMRKATQSSQATLTGSIAQDTQFDLRDLPSRIRMYGAYTEAEYFEPDLLAIVGDRFKEENNPYLMTEEDCLEEAARVMRRYKQSAYALRAAYMRSNPFLELSDRITSEAQDWIVEGLDYEITPGNIAMQLSARSYLI